MTTRAELLKAPLLPNKGAAGVKVGARAQAVKELWGEPAECEQIRSDFVRWSYGSVWFWLKAGRVDQIRVCEGYEGKTKEGLGIGSTKAQVEQLYGPLEWDGCWLINVLPFGIGFDFDDSRSHQPVVTGIYIFRE